MNVILWTVQIALALVIRNGRTPQVHPNPPSSADWNGAAASIAAV